MQENEIYAAIGEDGFERLVAAFYRQIPGDAILGPMYPAGDMEGAEKRLRDFLIFRFGGPATYIEERGHPRLRQRHGPFAVNQAARDRWLAIMTQALDSTALPAPADALLRAFFDSTSTFLMNRGEAPNALP